jgi:hypothetical protein
MTFLDVIYADVKNNWLILYTRFQQHVFPIVLGSYGPKMKWPRAWDKTLKGCNVPGQGIFCDFPPGPSQNSNIFTFLTRMHAWLFWNSVGTTKITEHKAIVECRPNFGDAFVQGL